MSVKMEQCQVLDGLLQSNGVDWKKFKKTYLYMKNHYSRYPGMVKPVLADRPCWEAIKTAYEAIPPSGNMVSQTLCFEAYCERVGRDYVCDN